ncbi:MAG TPA: arginyltransferase [Methylophilus sp.]|nr:arginyltransferase [Methylophilus sp.]HQQ32504.1 arginyltransferase [Methylophilus sp.]
MVLPNESSLQKLQFYVTTPYVCGYLPEQRAQSLIASPQHLITPQIYSNLIQQGFRRSGNFAYRPHCQHCQACISVRIILDEFKPNRSQKRAFKQHAELQANTLPLAFDATHYDLYQHYQTAKHTPPEPSQANDRLDEMEQYRQFLCQSNVESLMVEFRDQVNALKMVSVVDVVQDGLSAVYTFYDTSNPKASLGTYSILWLIEKAKNMGLPYLYLGYWIAASQKMAYKQSFMPQQRLIGDKWVQQFDKL